MPEIATHTASTLAEPWQKVRELNGVLGPTLVAVVLGSRDRSAPIRWARPDAGRMNDAAFERLSTAHQALLIVTNGGDEPAVARAWFLGANPRLGDESPVNAVHDGRHVDVLAAARAFAEDAWS